MLVVGRVFARCRPRPIKRFGPCKYECQLFSTHHAWIVSRHGRTLSCCPKYFANGVPNLIRVMTCKRIRVHIEVFERFSSDGLLTISRVTAGTMALESRPRQVIRCTLSSKQITRCCGRRGVLSAVVWSRRRGLQLGGAYRCLGNWKDALGRRLCMRSIRS